MRRIVGLGRWMPHFGARPVAEKTAGTTRASLAQPYSVMNYFAFNLFGGVNRPILQAGHCMPEPEKASLVLPERSRMDRNLGAVSTSTLSEKVSEINKKLDLGDFVKFSNPPLASGGMGTLEADSDVPRQYRFQYENGFVIFIPVDSIGHERMLVELTGSHYDHIRLPNYIAKVPLNQRMLDWVMQQPGRVAINHCYPLMQNDGSLAGSERLVYDTFVSDSSGRQRQVWVESTGKAVKANEIISVTNGVASKKLVQN